MWPTDRRLRWSGPVLALVIALASLACAPARVAIEGSDGPSESAPTVGQTLPPAGQASPTAGLTPPPAGQTPPPAGQTAPIPSDPWAVPFLTRTVSEPIHKTRFCDGIVIEGLTFRDLGPDVEAIHLERCRGVTIRANDFARVSQAITIIDSTDVTIEWNRYQDITGPSERVEGKHQANFIQLVRVTSGSINNNKGKAGDTEDIVSLFESGGTAKDPFIVEYNHFQGVDWTSGSGSGIALGDASSQYSIARYNTLLNPGQAGIFIAGGTNQSIVGNVVYGERRPRSNVGIYVWNQSSSKCANSEVRDNQVSWTNDAGAPNPAWNARNCGRVRGWDTNDWDAELDPATLEVRL